MSKFKVYDNYLPESDFKSVSDFLMGSAIDWHYNYSILQPGQVEDYDYNYQMIHNFYDGERMASEYLFYLDPIAYALGFKEPVKNDYPLFIGNAYRVKANLNHRMDKIMRHGFHVDPGEDANINEIKTAIFYVNSNDGYTEFEDGSIVESVANRIVIFDSHLKHTGTSCTNEKRRVVINFNYYET